ncbi:MAG TPA: hypothetical protein VFK40_11565 [Nitrososphaeraceae archaeon]|nr:hypothetical protein [Nitrososphaeraceae archaeon]
MKNQDNARAAPLYGVVKYVFTSFANFIDLSKNESAYVMYPINSSHNSI